MTYFYMVKIVVFHINRSIEIEFLISSEIYVLKIFGINDTIDEYITELLQGQVGEHG